MNRSFTSRPGALPGVFRADPSRLPGALAVLLILLLAGGAPVVAATPEPTSFRLRYLGSSCFAAPTGTVSSEMSYINDDSHNLTLLTQPVWGKFLEVSMLRHMNGSASGKSVMNLKVNVLEEGDYLPNVIWGVADFNTQLGSKIFYMAGSKTIESFAATLHAGFYKDPVTTEKKAFFGLEKTVLPLVVLAGERIDDQTTVGLKFRPYPGISVEYARRADTGSDQANLYKISYLRPF